MKLKFNVANIILPGVQLGEVAFEYEGTVLEIKESLELLPVVMEQYVQIEQMKSRSKNKKRTNRHKRFKKRQ